MKKLLLTVVVLSGLVACKGKKAENKLGSTLFPTGIDTQQIFALSMVSNLPAETYVLIDSADSAGAVQRIYNYAYPKMVQTLQKATDNTHGQNLTLSNWKIAWGPAIAVSTESLIDSSYISYSSATVFRNTVDTNNYVVAIQATNPNSIADWFEFDFNAGSTVPWTNFDPTSNNSGVISMGTNNGLATMLGLQSGGITIKQFLTTLPGSAGKNIIVTGHSLGGALSPVFSLYMQHEMDSLKINDTMYCLSTAGATPGNLVFANYFNNQIGNRSERVWNYFDLVPRGFSVTLLTEAIAGIYSQKSGSYLYDSAFHCGVYQPSNTFFPMPTPSPIKVALGMAISDNLLAKVSYTAICNNGTNFSGADTTGTGAASYLNVDTVSNPLYVKMAALITKWTDGRVVLNDSAHLFLCEEAVQHVASYAQHYQIKQIHEFMRGLITADSSSAMYANCKNIQTGTMLNKAARANPYNLMLGLIYMQAWK